MLNSIFVVVTKPLGVELSALGLRTAWACHENGFETKLLFSDDGVWCATEKDGYHTNMLKQLIEQDGEVYCLEESLEDRGLSQDDLIEGIEVVENDDLRDLCEDSECINHF